jgi:hypothetical protein
VRADDEDEDFKREPVFVFMAEGLGEINNLRIVFINATTSQHVLLNAQLHGSGRPRTFYYSSLPSPNQERHLGVRYYPSTMTNYVGVSSGDVREVVRPGIG